MKRKTVLMFLLLTVLTIIPLIGCGSPPPKTRELIYHGQITSVIRSKASFTIKQYIIITTPDGLLELDGQTFLLINNNGTINLVKWVGKKQFYEPDPNINGEYWIYFGNGYDYQYVISPLPILNWDNYK